MANKFDLAHMRVAESYAELSSAIRLKVGAVIVKDNRVISIGYNGTPAGWDNCCEYKVWDKTTDYELKTKPEVIHAEANAVAKLARCTESGEGAIMYVTHAPCFDCAKLIYTAGIKKVFYRKQYRNIDGLSFLGNCKIDVEEI